MARRSDEAFVLTRYPFRERDLVVVALARSAGVVRLLVRRARGPRTALAGLLEVLSLVRVTFFERRHSELATLDEAALVRSAFPLSSRPAAWAAGQVLAELVLLFAPPGQRSEAVFRLLDRCVTALLSGSPPRQVVDYASLWMLRLAGVFPDLERCGVCGGPLPRGTVRYHEEAQVLVCDGHAVAGRWQLSLSARHWLQAALTGPPESIGQAAPADARGWLDHLRRAFLERDLETLATFEALGGDSTSG